MRSTPLAVLLAALALAAPAYGQAPATVGPPQTITDPAAEVQAPAAPAASTGTVQAHHDAGRPTNQNTVVRAPHHSSAPPVAPRVHRTVTIAAPAPAPAPPAHTTRASPRQLPFTGIAAWQIAAIGLALIGVGYALWRVSPEP